MKLIPSWKKNDLAKPIFFNSFCSHVINHVTTGPIGTNKTLTVKRDIIPQALIRGYQVLIVDVENEYTRYKDFSPVLELDLVSRELISKILNTEAVYIDTLVRCLRSQPRDWDLVIKNDSLSQGQELLVIQGIKRIKEILEYRDGVKIFDYLNKNRIGRIILNPDYQVIQLILIILTVMKQYKDRLKKYLGTVIIMEEMETLIDLDKDRRYIPTATNQGRKRSIFLYYISHEPMSRMLRNPYWGSAVFNFDSITIYSMTDKKEVVLHDR